MTDASFVDEEIEEKRALYRGVYKPMKLWYASETPAAVNEKYGELPQFWQELENWPNTKALVKLYLTWHEKQQAGVKVDILELDNQLSAASKVSSQSEATVSSTGATEGTGAPKKKRSRWADAETTSEEPAPAAESVTPEVVVASSNVSNDSGSSAPPILCGEATAKPKKSRWGAPVAAPVTTPVPMSSAAMSAEIQQQTLILKMKLQHMTDKLVTVAVDAAIIEQDPNRSPSPPPKYDSNGKRTNTREIRMRENIMRDRVKVIEELIRLNPQYIPPADYVRVKPSRKLYIPIKEFPNYNFIGLIIGPRGNTQRQLEQQTGCKVSIRGKGSIKDGSRNRANKLQFNDEDDELHVYVQGETEFQVEVAAKIIQDILTPVDDESNEHKQRQLRELALINGMLRDDEYCTICGEKGHRQYECQNRTKSFKAAGVKCSICGELSHPTRDCPLKEEERNEVSLDQEYNSFMAELDGKAAKTATEETDTSDTSLQVKLGAKERVVETAKGKKQTIIHVQSVLTGETPYGNTATTPTAAAQTAPAATAVQDAGAYAAAANSGWVWNGQQYVAADPNTPSALVWNGQAYVTAEQAAADQAAAAAYYAANPAALAAYYAANPSYAAYYASQGYGYSNPNPAPPSNNQ